MKLMRALGALVAITLSANGFAKTCDLAIEGNDQMKYNVAVLSVAADCTDVKLTLKHAGKAPKTAMGHNWVLTEAKDFNAVMNDGIKAGPTQEYVPANDKRVIASTKVVGGGESTEVTFKTSALKKGGDYKFFCTFPGHSMLMNGKFEFGVGKAS